MAGYKYNKDEIKNNLDIESIAALVSHFGGEPVMKNGHFVAKTICHNDFGDGSHKLYYYENTSLFQCYTNCGSMDIFEIVIKAKAIQENVEWQLPQAMEFVVSFFGLTGLEIEDEERSEDWKVFRNHDRVENIDLTTKIVELKTYDKDILKYFPRPHIVPWELDGITKRTMDARDIAYNPMTGGIIIPHYNINGELVGIRERTLLEENEVHGKYMPMILNKVMYNHPLGYNLYGLDKSKDNIAAMKTAIVVEAEKSVLLYESYFGLHNSIICAACGSSLSQFQVKLLTDLGVREIIVGFDKDFKDKEDENFRKVINRLIDINKKYGCYVQISFLFDKEDLLGYKDSPLDCGKNTFLKLYENRITL